MMQSCQKKPVNAEYFDALKECFDASLESRDFTELVSPLKTPRWLHDYFWYDGFEKE